MHAARLNHAFIVVGREVLHDHARLVDHVLVRVLRIQCEWLCREIGSDVLLF